MSECSKLLSVESLSYEYGRRMAVSSVSFHIQPGECFGLLGPNGAGKTTTLSCIAGLLSEWSGEMVFRDQPYAPSANPNDRRKLGLVPQELALYPNLSAEENLVFFGELVGLSKQQNQAAVDKNLTLAGLTDRRRDLVRTFSGGMQRRLNLAIGLMNEPELLLLDEPTVGVDPQSRNHLFDTLEQLKADGLSILYTTHYMEEAQRLCERIAIMNEGKIIGTGTTQELAESIGQPEADLEAVFLNLTGRSLRDE